MLGGEDVSPAVDHEPDACGTRCRLSARAFVAAERGRARRLLGVLAAGNYEKGIGVGIEIAKMAEKITSQPTTFASALTGPYGSVGFMTGYENIAAFEAAQNALAGDAKWIKLVDSTQGSFVEDAAITQQTLHRRIA